MAGDGLGRACGGGARGEAQSRRLGAPMHIDHVTIQGLRALRQRDDAIGARLGAGTAVCVRGLNGAGKTTYLAAIAELWQWFRRCAKKRAWAAPSGNEQGLLAEAALVAVCFAGLPGPMPRMWLAFGRGPALAGFVSGRDDCPVRVELGQPTFDPALLEWWDTAFTRAEAGAADNSVPNVIFIGAEDKIVPQSRKSDLESVAGAPPYLALARYESQARGAAHLESIIGTLKLAHPARFDALTAWVEKLMPGMQLRGFDEARRPIFHLEALQAELSVQHLSAGERSTLINLVTVLRWGAPGGLILIDEPELHLHLSLLRGNVAVLDALARRGGGQLLVASHAPDVWRHFDVDHAFVELEGPPPATRLAG